MSGGHSTYEPKTGVSKWVDSRLPLPRLVYDSFVAYPTPRNLNYAYTFGAILSSQTAAPSELGPALRDGRRFSRRPAGSGGPHLRHRLLCGRPGVAPRRLGNGSGNGPGDGRRRAFGRLHLEPCDGPREVFGLG